MIDRYILVGREAVPCDDHKEWRRWFEEGRRIVAQDTVGAIWVSTVFLGIDHSWSDGPPILFETMVFGFDGVGEWQDRYSTYDQAEAGHAKALRVFTGLYKRWLERSKGETRHGQ